MGKAFFDASIVKGKPVYISYFFIGQRKKTVAFETSYPVFENDQPLGEDAIYIAELKAFEELLKAAKERKIKKIRVKGDNKRVIEDINNKVVNQYNKEVFDLIKQFEKVHLRWVRREGNMYADQLCKLGRKYGKYEKVRKEKIKYKMSHYLSLK